MILPVEGAMRTWKYALSTNGNTRPRLGIKKEESSQPQSIDRQTTSIKNNIYHFFIEAALDFAFKDILETKHCTIFCLMET